MTPLLPAFTHAPEINRVYNVDALTGLRAMADESVNCVISSPPYFGLRSYTDGDPREIGKEPTPREYVEALRQVFAECRRVLRNDGVLWLNLGDSYASGEIGRHDSVQGRRVDGKPVSKKFDVRQQSKLDTGLPSKSLLGIPWRAAFALQDDGWILRDEIIWHKPNPMPASVKDRTTRAHEQVFMFSKSQRYYYDQDAIKEPAKEVSKARELRGRSDHHKNVNGAPGQPNHSINAPRPNVRKQDAVGKREYTGFNERYDNRVTEMVNKRSVWTIPTVGFPGSHFATFPEDLIEPMILAGCPVGGVVLDPFFGAGTSGVVAHKLNRNWIGFDVNAEYVELATYRIQGRLDEYLAMKSGEPFSLYMFDEIEVTA